MFEHLCELARLELEAEELVEFERKFSSMLHFVEQVQAYEPQTEGAPLALIDRLDLRNDDVQRFDWAQDTRHDYRVPKIIDFEGGG